VLKIRGAKSQTDDDRVDEDLSVSHYYLQSGDSQGSYLRAKDAVKTEPDYAPTHFALAEAAKKLKKNEEALAEYNAYLKLDPDGEHAKAAEKAASELH
jgi:Tfp pilus assembly protein PilF